MIRSVLAIALLCAAARTASAADPFASAPPVSTTDPSADASFWHGLHVGSEVFASAGSHKTGGFGAAAFAGYDHQFDNSVILGVDVGVGRGLYHIGSSGVRGYDFATTSVKVAYPVGQFTPFVGGYGVFARPDSTPAAFASPFDTANNLFSSGPGLRASGGVTAGFDYAINNNLSVGMLMSVGAGRGGGGAP